MRVMFGAVSLLIVLAIVGILASRQLKAVNAIGATPATTNPPATAPTVREQSQQLQERVKKDVAGALQQGVDRNEQVDK